MAKIYHINVSGESDKEVSLYSMDFGISNTENQLSIYDGVLGVFREIFKTIDFSKVINKS